MAKEGEGVSEIKGGGKIIPPDVPVGCSPEVFYFECKVSFFMRNPKLQDIRAHRFDAGKMYRLELNSVSHKDKVIEKANKVNTWYRIEGEFSRYGTYLTESDYKKKGGTIRGSSSETREEPLQRFAKTKLGKKVVKSSK